MKNETGVSIKTFGRGVDISTFICRKTTTKNMSVSD